MSETFWYQKLGAVNMMEVLSKNKHVEYPQRVLKKEL